MVKNGRCETLLNMESNQFKMKADSFNPYLYIKQAEAYLESGDEFRAREVIVRRRNIPSDDPSVHVKWAKLCEELGMARQARESYERALKISPHDSEILYHLACLLKEIGYYEDSIHYLKKAIKYNPDHIEAKRVLSDDYRALGLTGQAEVLYPLPKKHTEPIRYFPPSISEEDTGKFLGLFAGREVGYALQVINEEIGTISYEFKEAPLDHDLVLKHINGDLTLTAYPLRTDNTVKYAIVETRLRKRVLKANIKNQAYLTYLNEKALHHSISLKQIVSQYGIPAYIDSSGDHSYRLWFFFSSFIHLLKVKDFLTRFLDELPIPDSNLVVEPILATKPVGIGWLEQAILLPLGINKATLKRSLFLDDHGRPYKEQLKFLKKIQEIPVREVKDAFRKSSLPVDKAGDIKLSEAIELLIHCCPVLSELSCRARSGRLLPYEEKVILFYTVGLIDRHGISLHRLLETSPDYNYEKVKRQVSRLKPNPISCLKIRELVPEITASVLCNCSFDLRGGKYPSPLLHVNPHLVPASKDFDIPEKISAREVAQRYVNLKRQAGEIEMAMKRLTTILDKYFNKDGIDKIRVGSSILQRKEDNGPAYWDI